MILCVQSYFEKQIPSILRNNSLQMNVVLERGIQKHFNLRYVSNMKRFSGSNLLLEAYYIQQLSI